MRSGSRRISQELALSVIEGYTERMNGACCSASGNNVLFDYSRCDPEFGTMQAKELHNHLSEV